MSDAYQTVTPRGGARLLGSQFDRYLTWQLRTLEKLARKLRRSAT